MSTDTALREALIEVIGGEGVWPDRVPHVADAILASGVLDVRLAPSPPLPAPSVTVTDEMVERAAVTIRDHTARRLGGAPIATPLWHNDRALARAALSAALNPQATP